MKKTQCCCIAIPLLGLVAVAGLAGYLLFVRWTVHTQVERGAVGDAVYVFGKVEDAVNVPLVATAYMVNDGEDSVWVVTTRNLPTLGRHVLVLGGIKSGLKIPGKLGGGTLLKHLEETDRWDFPM